MRLGQQKRFPWQVLRGVCLAASFSVALMTGFAQGSATPTDAVAEISAALRQQQFNQALELCAGALQAAPEDARIWTLQAIAQASLHRPAQAIESFHHALALRPEYYPALAGAAQLSFAERLPEAYPLVKRAAAMHPENQEAEAMLGALEFQKNDCQAAAAAFAQARDYTARQPQALAAYSTCLVKLSRFEEAVPVFEAMLRFAPGDPSLEYNLALAQADAGRREAAQTTLAPLVAADRPSEDVLTLAASIAEALQQTQQALDLLRRAILLYPHDENAYLDFVNLAYRHGSPAVGLDIVNVGIEQNPRAGQLVFARGVLQAELARTDAALADFDRAAALDPKLTIAGTAKGITESQTHDFPAALATLRKQVRAHPDDALASYLLAEALMQSGPAPGSPPYREEVRAAQRAAGLDPKQTQAHDLLATVYLAAGDAPRAVAECRASLQVDPHDQQALYHLILALRKSEQRAEIPALVQRLVEARRQAQEQTEKTRVHALTEAPSGP